MAFVLHPIWNNNTVSKLQILSYDYYLNIFFGCEIRKFIFVPSYLDASTMSIIRESHNHV